MTGAVLRARRLAGRIVWFELHLWLSLYRWVRHRGPVLGAGERPYPYVGAVHATIIAFIIVSAVEVPIAHVLLARWPTVQTFVLIAGVQGLLWMIALLGSLKIYPHLLTADGVRIRYAHSISVFVRWEDIASLGTRMRSPEIGKTAHVDRSGTAPVLNVVVGGQTNIDMTLRTPQIFTLPSGQTEPVAHVRFFTDEPADLVSHAQERIHAADVS